MARGAEAKKEVANKILEVFPGSFLYNNDKEIRIPMNEGGETIQIKVNLVCAKENVENSSDEGLEVSKGLANSSTNTTSTKTLEEPSAEEKQAVSSLCKKLGLI